MMRSRIVTALLLVPGLAAALPAQTPAPAPQPLSLEQALDLAAPASEAVGIAWAGVERARGQQTQARSEFFPQLSGSASYTRTLKSQYSALASDSAASDSTPSGPSSCNRFLADPSHPIGERVDSLESAVTCLASVNPFGAFSNLPFGQKNQYNLGLQLSQNLFAGGRIRAQTRIAAAGRRSAEVELTAQQAQLKLDVTQAYLDAVLSDRLVEIADSSLGQAERTLANTRLARKVGNVAEFDLLRAQVSRDNQRPVLIQRRSQREIAYLRLRQLLNLPLEQPLLLTTSLGDGDNLPIISVAPRDSADTTTDRRAAVQRAVETVHAQEGQLAVARAGSLPSLRLTSAFARIAYPRSGFPGWNDFLTDWSVSLIMQVPIFTGGRLHGDRIVAQANLDEARLRLQQTREQAALDARSSLATLRSAEAAWEASAGTVAQARRAYDIAEIRYREGISTQTELGDSRLLLQQAAANRAQAARDLQVARVRLALLPDLPLAAGSAGASASPPMAPAMPQQQAQPAATGTQLGASAAGGQLR